MSVTTEQALLTPQHPIKKGEPAWDIALLHPPQGHWTEEEYLSLGTNWMIEFEDGCIEVLPMPTPFHQRITQLLYELFKAFVVDRSLGEVFIAPMPVRLRLGRLREPDIVFVRPGRITNSKKPPKGADLALEVVSEGEENRRRDIKQKRVEYANAKIPEYWIVDPEEQKITVLTLGGKTYRVHGEFRLGKQAASKLLKGFAVDVSAVFAAGEGKSKRG